jgi:hypothetical protein
MSRLSLQVFYLWRHILSTAPPVILWWSNLELLFAPLHRSSPFIGRLRCQAIQTEHGPYIAERTQKAAYIVRCLCFHCSSQYVKLFCSWQISCVWLISDINYLSFQGIVARDWVDLMMVVLGQRHCWSGFFVVSTSFIKKKSGINCKCSVE